MKRKEVSYTYFSRLRLFVLILLSGIAVSCGSDVMEHLVSETGSPTSSVNLTVLTAASISNTSVRVTFSREVDSVTAENPSNYTITNGLTVLGAVRDPGNFSIVDLTTGSQSNTAYTVTAANITDTLGNPLETPDSGDFTGDALPFLVSATANTNTSVLLQFSEPVALPGAELPGNYSADNGLIITGAARNPADFSEVELATDAQANISYTITVSNLTDSTGNAFGAPFTDTFTGYTAPTLVSASADSNTSVTLQFSEAMELLSAENEANYSIPGLAVTLASRDAFDYSLVHLTTATQSAVGYTVTAGSIVSLLGVPMSAPDAAAFTGDAIPYLVSATPTGTTSITVLFSEAVDLASAETEANYSIPGLTVSNAARDAVDFSRVVLTTSVQGASSYTLTVTGVTDVPGNAIGTPNTDDFLGYTQPTLVSASAQNNTTVDLQFSEAMDQAGAETEGNYSIPGLTVALAIRDAVDFSIVHLTTDTQSDIPYTVTVSNVTSVPGVPIGAPDSAGFTGDALPNLVSALATDGITVELQFSEEVDLASAEIEANYSIPGLTVTNAVRDLVDFSVVLLTTSVQSSSPYTLTVSNVTDIPGNAIGTPNTANFNGFTPLSLASASASNNTTVSLQFSEDVELLSAETEGNYSVPGLTVTLAERDALDYSIVHLTTSSQTGIGYTVTVSNVTNLSGTPIGTPNSAAFTGDALPYLVNAVTAGAMAVDLQFSEPVELTSAENEANYSIPGLSVTLALRDPGDDSIVQLTTVTQEDVTYTVTVSGVTDANGNPIGTPNSDTFAGDTPPELISVSSAGNTTVYIYFSEAVDDVTANNAANYAITPAIGVVSAARDATDFSKVVVTTGGQTSGTLYSTAVSNVEDLIGSVITSPSTGYFTGTGLTDTTKPYVVSAARIDATTVEIVFSEPVGLASSQTAGNYTILDSTQNSVSITSAVRQADTSRVRLATGSGLTDHMYTVIVSTNVRDLNNNSLQGAPMNTASFSGSGTMPQYFTDGPVSVDPMNEGANPYGLMIKYRNRIYLGPSSADNAMIRMKADGSDPEMVRFIFHGNGSTTTSLNPGPDGEDGIDYFTGGTINGIEYMFIGPSNSGGNLRYIYYTTDSGTTINFHYMDFNAVLGAQTRGTSSMAVYNNRLYTGFPDTGGARPYFIKLVNVVQAPVAGTDIINLQGDNFPRMGTNGNPYSNSGSPVGIDVMIPYNDRLYIANGGNNSQNQDGGIVKSTSNDPRDYAGFPGDWTDITPTADAEWYNSPTISRFSTGLSSSNKLVPADRAFPSMAVFNGKLYAIRNTNGGDGGPQIWKYDGSAWSMVADAGGGISDMNNSNNGEITLLVTNGDRLYVGYDNWSDGVTVYRTKSGSTDPSAVADFELVSAGLGDANGNKNIFSALSASYGGVDYLWILCGKGWVNLRLYRTRN